MSLHTLLEKLTSGKSEADRLVVPEGYTVREIAKAVAANGRISEADFLKAASSSDQLLPYMKGNRNVTFPTEGFLFPDTYFIPYDATADDVVAMMLKNFDAHLTDAMKAGIAKQNLSIYQFVTLASLIEKEAKYEKDRPPYRVGLREPPEGPHETPVRCQHFLCHGDSQGSLQHQRDAVRFAVQYVPL